MAPWVARRVGAQYGPSAAAEVVAYQLDQLAALKGVIEKEKIDCEFSLTRSFDVFFDEDHSREMQEFVSTQQAEGAPWAQHMTWIDASESEKVPVQLPNELMHWF